MRPETQGKMMVAMVVSLIAFGLGTGTVLVTGQFNNLTPALTFNSTPQGDLPVVYNQGSNGLNSGSSPTVNNPSTPSTSSSGGSSSSGSSTSGGQSNQNNPSSGNNTTQG